MMVAVGRAVLLLFSGRMPLGIRKILIGTKKWPPPRGEGHLVIQVLNLSLVDEGRFMQENVVELIRELMKTQRMSIRKISARIAKEQGGSAMGYTQQINRILNDPDYDPNFSTVQKVLAALNCSFWQTTVSNPPSDCKSLEERIDRLDSNLADIKTVVQQLQRSLNDLVENLQEPSEPRQRHQNIANDLQNDHPTELKEVSGSMAKG